ncbi:YqgE/AlgH family protein [Rubrivirga sp.]|uniref:YqgE/AlgH family protein n=1 Tax=Rubrivirga sp. TaxID=1885344 RepID=UPI003B51D606
MPAPVPGDVLVAEPPMADPNFRRTVVLLCEHTTEGSFGLVLNRPTGLTLAQATDEAIPFDADLWLGGPVQPDTLHYLHPYAHLDGTLPVLDDVFWGGDFEALRELIAGGVVDPGRIRFFVGYSGWGAGQLDAEVDEGAWIVLPGSEALVFADGDDALWRQVLRQLGGEYALLSTFPDDPRLN